jgi:hypothetical protein
VSTLDLWPELQPLAARVAVGELDGEEAIAAIVDAIVQREVALGGRNTPSLRASAAAAVAEDRVLMAMLRPAMPTRDLLDDVAPGRGRAPGRAVSAVRLAPQPEDHEHPGDTGAFGRDGELDDALDDDAPPPRTKGARARGGAARPVARAEGRRIHPGVGVAIGAVVGGAIWWFLIRQTPCETFARQVCLELAEPCSAGEVEGHLERKAVAGTTCDAALAAAGEAAAKAPSSRRPRAYLDALVATLGFDPRTGEAPPPQAASERPPSEPVLLARKLPSLPSLEVDEAYLWVSSGEAVLKLRSTGGAFEPLATAPGARAVAVTNDFVYWAARGADGSDAIYVDRKRGEYEPTVLPTTPAKLGAVRCTLGACAYVDLADGAVWVAGQDGTAPRKLVAGQSPAPTEVWIDDREVAYGVAGTGVIASPVEGGTPRVVAGAEAEVKHLEGDGDAWFWIAAGAVRSVPRGGGDVATLVPQGAVDFAIDKTHVFAGDATAGTIVKVPRTGGSATAVVSGQVGIEHVVVDAAAVYWTRAGDLFRLPKV